MSEQTEAKAAVVWRRIAKTAVCCAVLAASGAAWAADARDYIPMADRTFLFATYAKHVSGNKLYADSKQVSADFNLTQNLGIFRPVYFRKVSDKALYGDGGLVVDPQMLFIFGEGHVDGAALDNASLQAGGIADPVLLATLWFVNAPKDQLWVGFTPYLTVPLGEYSSARALNLGSNRWAFKPEFGIVKGFGSFYVDLIVNAEFYGANDKSFAGGGPTVKLEQEPLYGAETHLSYDISKTWYAALDYFYTGGGETKSDGVLNDNAQGTSSLGASFFWLLGTSNQLMLQYRQDLSVKNGPSTSNFGARWAFFF